MTRQGRKSVPRPHRAQRRSGSPRLWLPLLLALLLPGPAGAQARAPELEVVIAALPYLQGALPPGKVTFDPEPFCEARLIGWTCPDPLHEAARTLGLRLNSRAFTHVCLGGPTSCRLVGADALVVLDPPVVERDSATLDASLWWRAGTRARPVDERRLRLLLVRGRGGWSVVGEEAREDG